MVVVLSLVFFFLLATPMLVQSRSVQNSLAASAFASSKVIANIIVGDEPNGIAFDSVLNRVYVSHSQLFPYGSIGNVTVIDALQNKVIGFIKFDANPGAVLYNPANQKIYVGIGGAIAVVDSKTNKILATISANGVGALTYDSIHHYVWATAWNSIDAIDSSTNKIVKSVAVSSGSNLAFDSNKGYLYISDDYANTLQVLSTSTDKIIASIPVCNWCDPGVMGFDPSNGRVYVANWGKGTLSVISDQTNKIVATIPIGSNPWGVTYDRLNDRVYVAGYTSAVFQIDPSTNTVAKSFQAGNGAWNIAIDTIHNNLYVSDLGSNTVTVTSA